MNTRITKIRKEHRKTQAQFAESLNLSRNFICRMETGEREPSDRTISDICRIYSINENWLRTGEGDMYVKRTKNQEIAAFIGEFSNDKDGSFKRDLVHVLSQLSEEQWGLLADMAEKLYQEHKKRADQ